MAIKRNPSTIKRNPSKIEKKKKRRQEIKDEIIEDFLEERKQFFDSFCTTSLATTPMKHELPGRR